MNKMGILEGLLFVVGDEGLTLKQIGEILEINEEEAKELLRNLMKRYEEDCYGISLRFLGDTIKLTTKKEHKPYYQKLVECPETNTLSQAALETLAIVAYNEPITVAMIEEIRGVSSRDMVRKLVAKGMLKEVGKSDVAGRPTLFQTTSDFLDYFGLSSKEELPKLEKMTSDNMIDETDLYDSKYKEKEEL